MLIKHLHRWLTTPIDKPFNLQIKFWLSLSLVFSLIYGLQGLREAFSGIYVIQDDARQHVFWMQRFLDPSLFPNDLIADYYQSTAPLGYTNFYRLFALIGIDPILLSKLLPIFLGLLATIYGFGFCLQIFPVPAAGFIFTLLLNYGFWSGATLVTATPRAFIIPFFLAFLYYLLRRSVLPCSIAIALQGLFYPPSALLTAGILILRLFHWKQWLPSFSLDRKNYLLCTAGLVIVFLVLLPQVLDSSEFGPTISLAEAKALPEFQPGGRTSFFLNNAWDFWFNSHRSALMGWPWKPPILYTALLLPILLRYPSHFPLVKQITPGITLLLQALVVSLGLFFTAHAVLFKLYLPSRYTLGFHLAIHLSAAITLVVILDTILRTCEQQNKISPRVLSLFFALYSLLVIVYWLTFYYPQGKKFLAVSLALGIGITLIVFLLNRSLDYTYLGQQLLALSSTVVLAVTILSYPSLASEFPKNDYEVGEAPQLYEFFAKQPKNILIASLAEEADNLPSFAKRSVLVGQEYALPYEIGYYKQIRQRIIDLIQAQYTPDLEQVKNFIQKYGIDFWLLDREAFTPEYLTNTSWHGSWIRQYQPAATEAIERLNQRTVPALKKVMKSCSVLNANNLVVLNTVCVAKSSLD